VSKTTVHESVTEKLRYRKLCARWVTELLTDDHKMKQMGSALKFLMRYAQEGDEFLDSTVTGDETRVFHHTTSVIIKPTRCTNFTNLFWHETLHVSDSSSAHHQEFIHCKLSNGMCHTGL
jgi:hypothetical protein